MFVARFAGAGGPPRLRWMLGKCAVLGAMASAVFAQPKSAQASTFISAPDRVDFIHDTTANLVYISSGSQILRYRPSDGTFLSPWLVGGSPAGLDYDPNSRTLAVADRQKVSGDFGRVVLIHTETGAQKEVQFQLKAFETGSYSVAFDATSGLYFTPAGTGVYTPLLAPLRRIKTAVFGQTAGAVEELTTGQSTYLPGSSVLTPSSGRSVLGIGEGRESAWGYVVTNSTPAITRYTYSGGQQPSAVIPEDGATKFLLPLGSSSQIRSNANAMLTNNTGPALGGAYNGNQAYYYLSRPNTNTVAILKGSDYSAVSTLTAQNTFTAGTGIYRNGYLRISRNYNRILLATVPGGVELFDLSEGQGANSHVYDSTPEDTTKWVDLPIADAPAGHSGVTYTVVQSPFIGSVSTLSTTSTGVGFYYTPTANANGTDFISVKAVYNMVTHLVTKRLNLTMEVLPVNDVPTAIGSSNKVYSAVPTEFVLRYRDSDATPGSGGGGNPAGNYTIRIVSPPTRGTLVSLNDGLGTMRFTPYAPYTGSDPFTWAVSDGIAESAVVSSSLYMSGAPPISRPDNFRAPSKTTVSLPAPGLMANDTYTPGSVTGLTITTQPAYGTVSVASPVTGAFNWTANGGTPPSNGLVEFYYTLRDGITTTSPTKVTININPYPTANPQSVTLDQDTSANITLTGSGNSSNLVFSIYQQPIHGVLSGTVPNLVYTPEAGYVGTDSFKFWLNDGFETSTPATVSINVVGTNVAPVATDGTLNVDEDTSGNVTLDVTDSNGDELTYEVITAPLHGTLTGTAPNFIYTPAANYHGPDSFTFQAADQSTVSNLGTVTIAVASVNDLPVASNQTFEVTEDTAKSFTLNVSDADGDNLTFETVTAPEHGTLTGEGTELTYSPAPNFTGTDTYVYTVTDPSGAAAQATVTFEISSTNDAPTGASQNLETNEDTAKTFTLAGNDVDGDVLTYTIVERPNGTLSGTAPNLTYTPAANWSGDDFLTYTVSDASTTSPAYRVDIKVLPVNDTPVPGTVAASTDEDTAVAITLTATDADADELTFTAGTAGHGTLSGTAPNLTYTPEANWTGTDSFSFTVSDGTAEATGTATITVNPINDAPSVTQTSYTTAEDTALPISLAIADPDNSTFTVSVTGTNEGTVSKTGPTSLTYYPKGNWFGTDTFTISVSDGTATVAATITVTVTPVNDPPVANFKQINIDEDTVGQATITATDADGDALTYVVTVPPTKGTLSGTAPNLTYTPNANAFGLDAFEYTVSDGTVTKNGLFGISIRAINDVPVARSASVEINEDVSAEIPIEGIDPETTYQPSFTVTITRQPVNGTVYKSGTVWCYRGNQDWNGSDSVEYTVTDTDGAVSAPGTINITVKPVNDYPVTSGQTVTTDEDAPVQITLPASDVDGDALTYSIGMQPHGGTLSGTGPTFTFTPHRDFYGTTLFSFGVSDGNLAAGAQVTINVTGINDPPVANPDTFDSAEDETLNMNWTHLTYNDTDVDGGGDGSKTTVLETQAAHGVVTLTTNGRFTYVPQPNFNGVDSFTYRAKDALGAASAPATVTLNIAARQDAPTAAAVAATTAEDTAMSVVLKGTDVDNEALTYTYTAPANGTLSGTAPNLTFTPAANWSGTTSFNYTVKDPQNATATNTVTITVNAVNDAPVANAQSVSVSAGVAKAVTLTGTDVEGSVLTYTIVANPTKGTLSGSGANRTYTPNSGATGADSFTFKVNDGQLDSATVAVSITITGSQTAPYAVLYTITNQWPGGFTADVKITNVSGANINGWTLAWSFAGDQKITNLWNGVVTQSGKNVSVKDASWNKVINTGGSQTIGFQATFSGTNAKPTSFTLNGVNCTVQ